MAADIIHRAEKGTLGDINIGKRMQEVYLSTRSMGSPNDMSVVDYFIRSQMDMSVPSSQASKVQRPIGELLSNPLIPLTNIRDAWAQINAEEGARRDLTEQPILGPIYEKLPWFRRRLPLQEGPTEVSPQAKRYAPLAEGELSPLAGAIGLAQGLGVTLFTPGTNFATREFARLGLNPYRWLQRNPDPKINRAQLQAFTRLLEQESTLLERSEYYKKLTDAEKAAEWEEIIYGAEGVEGIASMATEEGKEANPEEADLQDLLKSEKPLRRKASGLDKEVEEMRKQFKERAKTP